MRFYVLHHRRLHQHRFYKKIILFESLQAEVATKRSRIISREYRAARRVLYLKFPFQTVSYDDLKSLLPNLLRPIVYLLTLYVAVVCSERSELLKLILDLILYLIFFVAF